MKHLRWIIMIPLLAIITCRVAAQSDVPSSMTDPFGEPLMQYTPTAQTWSFIRYGNTPVDHYTGTAQASIPIYDYSDPNFSFSIAAGYASNGFMPQRQSGILGMGWFLNCGGAVTREIKGRDDFEEYGFLWGAGKFWDELIYGDVSEVAWVAIIRPEVYTTSDIGHELNADIFHFNFMGHSGSFHFDGQRNIKVYNTGGGSGTYKVEFSSGMSKGNAPNSTITITTDDGYIYVFGGMNNNETTGESSKERSMAGKFSEEYSTKPSGSYDIIASQNLSLNPIVTWNLTRVIAPNGRTITFTYDMGNTFISYLDRQYNNPHYATSFATGWSNPPRVEGETKDPEHYRQVNIIRTTYLTEISVSDGVNISMLYSVKDCRDADDYGIVRYPDAKSQPVIRSDNNIAQRLLQLDEIKVRYPGKKQPLRTAQFAYHTERDRLFLDTINVSGVGTYKMAYHPLDPNAHCGISTSAVDFWGYFNGKHSHYSAICPMSIPSGSFDEVIAQDYKNPDWKYSIMGCLKHIQYPTKGLTEFEYEANTANYMVEKRLLPSLDIIVPEPIVIDGGHRPVPYLARLGGYHVLFGDSDETGGVRIRKITDHDAMGGSQTREFGYIGAFGKSSGTVLYFPRFAWANFKGWTVRNPILSYPANTFDKSHIGYETVREFFTDGSSVQYDFNSYRTHPDDYEEQSRKDQGRSDELVPPGGVDVNDNGKIEYIEEIYAQKYADFMNNILREPNSHHCRRGKLNTKTFYDAQNNIVRRERMKYNDSDDDFSTYVVASGDYIYSVKKPTTDYRLTEQTVTEYFGTDSLLTTTSYLYNNAGQLRQTNRLLPDRSESTTIKYMHEISDSLSNMPKKYPYEVITEFHPMNLNPIKYITSATRYTYTTIGNMTKPRTVSKVDMRGAIPVRTSPVPHTILLDYTDKITYDAYDAKGNPTQVTDNATGLTHVLIWGYKGLYPVAKVRNATYTQLCSVLGISGSLPLPGALSAQQINALYALPNAMVEVYEHRPFAGPTRHIDPSGREHRYEYDPHGRLTEQRDGQGVLQKYQYFLQ